MEGRGVRKGPSPKVRGFVCDCLEECPRPRGQPVQRQPVRGSLSGGEGSGAGERGGDRGQAIQDLVGKFDFHREKCQ